MLLLLLGGGEEVSCGLLTLLQAKFPCLEFYPVSRLFSMRSVDSAFGIGGRQNRGFVLLKKKTKQRATSALTIMQPAKTKPIIPPPPATTERFTVLFSSFFFCTVVDKRLACVFFLFFFYSYPSKKSRWRNLNIYLEGARSFFTQTYLFWNICLRLAKLQTPKAKLDHFIDDPGCTERGSRGRTMM